jgi:hypothetical protein
VRVYFHTTAFNARRVMLLAIVAIAKRKRSKDENPHW